MLNMESSSKQHCCYKMFHQWLIYIHWPILKFCSQICDCKLVLPSIPHDICCLSNISIHKVRSQLRSFWTILMRYCFHYLFFFSDFLIFFIFFWFYCDVSTFWYFLFCGWLISENTDYLDDWDLFYSKFSNLGFSLVFWWVLILSSMFFFFSGSFVSCFYGVYAFDISL